MYASTLFAYSFLFSTISGANASPIVSKKMVVNTLSGIIDNARDTASPTPVADKIPSTTPLIDLTKPHTTLSAVVGYSIPNTFSASL